MQGKKMDALAAIDKYGKIRCGGGLDGAITGSYTRFAQRTTCTRSGAMKQDRVYRIERTIIKPSWMGVQNTDLD